MELLRWDKADLIVDMHVIARNLSICLEKGDSMGIVGANGSGKTVIAMAMAGLIPVNGLKTQNNVKKVFVSCLSHFRQRDGSYGYRQQRWNMPDKEMIPTVTEDLAKIEDRSLVDSLIEKFDFQDHQKRLIISLSNGEQRKLEIIKALSQKPDLLIIDNAFDGLDAESVILLNNLIDRLVNDNQSIVLTALDVNSIPKSIQQFLYIDGNKKTAETHQERILGFNNGEKKKIDHIPPWQNSPYYEIISMRNVHMKMGGHQILKDISWTIKAGERWVLSGPNGSGKTSLLNMIFADTPMAYGCDIRLFGKKKGSGETIWEIKDRIGFISPELHQYLQSYQSVKEVICSGYFVSEGLYRKPTTLQQNKAVQWLRLTGLEKLENKAFKTLCSSEQKIVLMLRALVSNPPLLILDEPFQGMDDTKIELMKGILNLIAHQTNCTMIFVTHLPQEIPESFNLELKLLDGAVKYSGIRKL